MIKYRSIAAIFTNIVVCNLWKKLYTFEFISAFLKSHMTIFMSHRLRHKLKSNCVN